MDSMDNYVIKELNYNYKYVVFATTYENPLENLTAIKKFLCAKNFKGKIIFDLLLSNGNEPNRFIESYFDGIYFDDSTFKIAKVDNIIEEFSLNFFHNNLNLLNNSILNNIEKFLIENKIKIS